MRISAKGRYGLAAMITIALESQDNECIPVILIAEKLGLSKIYLEQVFALLKRGQLVDSVKGAQGGYRLRRSASAITVYEILTALEQLLFEPTEKSVEADAPAIEVAMDTVVFSPLDAAIKTTLQAMTLDDLVTEVARHQDASPYMFFI